MAAIHVRSFLNRGLGGRHITLGQYRSTSQSVVVFGRVSGSERKEERRGGSSALQALPCRVSQRFYSSPATPTSSSPAAPLKGDFWEEHKKTLVAGHDFNRWKLIPTGMAIHVCLGTIYGWSLFNEPFTRTLGVIGQAADDWTMTQVVPVFSTIVGLHGLSAAALVKLQLKVGPRFSGLLGATSFGSGMALASFAISMHSLPLLYVGGFLAGCGLGFTYVPPIATLIQWFPDKKGFATGLTVMGFGGGALVVTPIKMWLMEYFSRAPDFVGKVGSVPVINEKGRLFAETAQGLKEVLIVNAGEVSQIKGLEEGLYAVGTGNTGASATLLCLGAAYFTIIASAAMALRTAPANYVPPGFAPPLPTSPSANKEEKTESAPVQGNVNLSTAVRTPQFWFMWGTFTSLATAGMGVMSMAKTMMGEIGTTMPHVVTPELAASFVMALSAANLTGRLVWAAASDVVGCKRVFTMFGAVATPLYLSIPYFVNELTLTQSIMPLGAFVGCTLVSISFFGAAYSTMPAYEAAYFGPKHVGAIHGVMLTASTAAAIIGPVGISRLRESATREAVADLVSKVSPDAFIARFGAGPGEWEQLYDSKMLTIKTVLPLCPSGTLDPTPFLYDNVMYGAGSLAVVALLCNLMVKKVDPKLHEKSN